MWKPFRWSHSAKKATERSLHRRSKPRGVQAQNATAGSRTRYDDCAPPQPTSSRPLRFYQHQQLTVAGFGSTIWIYNWEVLVRFLAVGSLALVAWGQALEEGKRAFDARNYAAAVRLFEKAHR